MEAVGTCKKSGGRGASSAGLADGFGVARKSGGRGASSLLADDLRLESKGVPAEDAESTMEKTFLLVVSGGSGVDSKPLCSPPRVIWGVSATGLSTTDRAGSGVLSAFPKIDVGGLGVPNMLGFGVVVS